MKALAYCLACALAAAMIFAALDHHQIQQERADWRRQLTEKDQIISQWQSRSAEYYSFCVRR